MIYFLILIFWAGLKILELEWIKVYPFSSLKAQPESVTMDHHLPAIKLKQQRKMKFTLKNKKVVRNLFGNEKKIETYKFTEIHCVKIEYTVKSKVEENISSSLSGENFENRDILLSSSTSQKTECYEEKHENMFIPLCTSTPKKQIYDFEKRCKDSGDSDKSDSFSFTIGSEDTTIIFQCPESLHHSNECKNEIFEDSHECKNENIIPFSEF